MIKKVKSAVKREDYVLATRAQGTQSRPPGNRKEGEILRIGYTRSGAGAEFVKGTERGGTGPYLRRQISLSRGESKKEKFGCVESKKRPSSLVGLSYGAERKESV